VCAVLTSTDRAPSARCRNRLRFFSRRSHDHRTGFRGLGSAQFTHETFDRLVAAGKNISSHRSCQIAMALRPATARPRYLAKGIASTAPRSDGSIPEARPVVTPMAGLIRPGGHLYGRFCRCTRPHRPAAQGNTRRPQISARGLSPHARFPLDAPAATTPVVQGYDLCVFPRSRHCSCDEG